MKKVSIECVRFSDLPGFGELLDQDLKITIGDHINIYTRDEVIAEVERHRLGGNLPYPGKNELDALCAALNDLPVFTYICFGASNEEPGFPIREIDV